MVVISRDGQLRCRLLNCKLCGEFTQRSFGVGRCSRDLLIGRLENTLLLFFYCGLDAGFVRSRILLSLGTKSSNLAVELCQSGLNIGEPRVGLFCRRAGLYKVFLDSLCTATKSLGKSTKESVDDGDSKNKKVQPCKDGGGGLR